MLRINRFYELLFWSAHGVNQTQYKFEFLLKWQPNVDYNTTEHAHKTGVCFKGQAVHLLLFSLKCVIANVLIFLQDFIATTFLLY